MIYSSGDVVKSRNFFGGEEREESASVREEVQTPLNRWRAVFLSQPPLTQSWRKAGGGGGGGGCSPANTIVWGCSSRSYDVLRV